MVITPTSSPSTTKSPEADPTITTATIKGKGRGNSGKGKGKRQSLTAHAERSGAHASYGQNLPPANWRGRPHLPAPPLSRCLALDSARLWSLPVVVTASGAVQSGSAQATRSYAPRAGDPDIQGFWSYNDDVNTPFERPCELGSKVEFGDEELAAVLEERARRNVERAHDRRRDRRWPNSLA